MYKLIYLARRGPNVSRADWPEVWRSHARFATQFARLKGGLKYGRYCNRIDGPEGGAHPAWLSGVSTEHDGVAMMCSEHIEAMQGGAFTTAERALIQQDELRVFDRLTPDFSYYCTETPVRDGEMSQVGLFRFMHRLPDVPRLALKEHLLGEHARIVEQAIGSRASVVRYTHNLPLHRPLPLYPFDAISECWFTSMEEAVRAMETGQLAPIEEDLAGYCDGGRGVTILTEVVMHWP